MGKINDLPKLDRPREKALRYGIDKLSDYELLALLISSGCKDSSATDIAYAMISENNGLSNLINKPFLDLVNYKGMGKAKALKIEAAFEIARRFQSLKYINKEKVEDLSLLYSHFCEIFLRPNIHIQESLFLLILDRNKRIIHEVNLYKGSEDSINYSFRQIINQVLLHNGHFFYVIHNHPSDSLEPSDDDCFFTINLIKECKKFHIKMLDHLIISSQGYYSFATKKTVKKEDCSFVA